MPSYSRLDEEEGAVHDDRHSLGLPRGREIEQLGPFEPKPIEHEAIGFDVINIDDPDGGDYVVNFESESLIALDLSDLGLLPLGRLSPKSPVTLASWAKRSAHIPPEAEEFAFAYPLSGIGDFDPTSELDMDPKKLEHAFLLFGGFVYFARDSLEICGVNALTLGPGLHFKPPRKLSDIESLRDIDLRAKLYDERRVETATLTDLVDAGIIGFCWLLPGELGVTEWPNGAFAYFYEEDDDMTADCYLAVSQLPLNEISHQKAMTFKPRINEAPAPTPGASSNHLCTFSCFEALIPSERSERVKKAEARFFMQRPLEQIKTVRVLGHITHGERHWYRKKEELQKLADGSVWKKIEEPIDRDTGKKVKLVLLQGRPKKNHRIETFTQRGRKREGRSVTRDLRDFNLIHARDLEDKADGRITSLDESRLQYHFSWYLMPSMEDCASEGDIAPPDASAGKIMQLALPFSLLHSSIVSYGQPSDFGSLGIGVELYFSQLVSLGLCFLIMGLVSMGSLVTNVYEHIAYTHTQGNSTLSTGLEIVLMGSTLGARRQPFDLFQAGMIEFSASLVFIIYLAWLHQFNLTRARATQESSITPADFTVVVKGLSALPEEMKNKKAFATAIAEEVIQSWVHVHTEEKKQLGAKAGGRSHDSPMKQAAAQGASDALASTETPKDAQSAPVAFRAKTGGSMIELNGGAPPAPSQPFRACSALTSPEAPATSLAHTTTPGALSEKQRTKQVTDLELAASDGSATSTPPPQAPISQSGHLGGVAHITGKGNKAFHRKLLTERELSSESARMPQKLPALSKEQRIELAANPNKLANKHVHASALLVYHVQGCWRQFSSQMKKDEAHHAEQIREAERKSRENFFKHWDSRMQVWDYFRLRFMETVECCLTLKIHYSHVARASGQQRVEKSASQIAVTPPTPQRVSVKQRLPRRSALQPSIDVDPAHALDGDFCFVTFRYASDAEQARWLWRSWSERFFERIVRAVTKCNWEEGFTASRQMRGLRAVRAPEPSDIKWENLAHEGSLLHRKVAPCLTVAILIGLSFPVFVLVFRLTEYKLDISERSESNFKFEEAGQANASHFHKFLDNSLDNVVMVLPEDLHRDSYAVIIVSLILSATIFVVNFVLRQVLGLLVAKIEKPGTYSFHHMRLLTMSSLVYIINYVVMLFVVHSFSSDRALQLVEDFLKGEGAVQLEQGMVSFATRVFNRCMTEINDRDHAVDVRAQSCASSFVIEIVETLSNFVTMLVDSISSQADQWYADTGLVPQVIVLAVTDVLIVNVSIESNTILRTLLRRFWGRCHFSQAATNARYDPIEFSFADRFAVMLKHAAIVLVFAPAAPILYFIGAGSMLFSSFVQKWALVKLYKRPRQVNEQLAERSRKFLVGLLVLHLIFSPIFYAAQAKRTQSLTNKTKLSPFAYSFFAVILSLIASWVIGQRDENKEVSGAEEQLFQDERDDHGDQFQDYSLPASTLSSLPSISEGDRTRNRISNVAISAWRSVSALNRISNVSKRRMGIVRTSRA